MSSSFDERATDAPDSPCVSTPESQGDGRAIHRVFLVEDDMLVVQALKRRLPRVGFDICGTATSGESALASIPDARPSVVLLDLTLEGTMKGEDVLARLAEAYPHLPVVVLSGSVAEAGARIAAKGQSYALLSKPCASDVLAVNLELAVARAEFDRRLRHMHDTVQAVNAELELSEARLRRVVDHISDALVLEDPGGAIVFANDRFWELIGAEPGKLESLSSANFVAPDFRELYDGWRHAHLADAGARRDLVFQVQRVDGCIRWVEASTVPVRDASGRVAGLESLLRDITERKQAEAEREEQRQFLRTAQHVAKVGSWRVDLSSGRCALSEGLEHLLGSDAQGETTTFAQLVNRFHEDDRHRFSEMVRNTGERGGEDAGRFTIVHHDGSRRVHWVTCRAFHTDGVGEVVGANADITEREEQARELQLASFGIEKVAEGFCVFDPSGRIVSANPALARMVGKDIGQVIGARVWDLDPGWPERSWPLLWKGLQQRAQVAIKRRLTVAGEGPRILELSITHGAFGTQDLGCAIVRDVTAGQLAELELRRSKEHYESLFNELTDGVFRAKLDGEIVASNPAFAHIVGAVSPDELVGRNIAELFVSAEHAASLRIGHRTDADSYDVEAHWRRLDGLEIVVELRCDVLPRAEHEPTFFQGIVRDVTAERSREAREKALLAHKEQLELVVEGTRLGFWDWNPQTDDIRFSPRWTEMFGYEVHELEGRFETYARLLHPDDVSYFQQRLHRHLQSGEEHFEAVVRMRHRDGQWLHILNRGKVFGRDDSGKATRFCGTHTDITLQKSAEAAALEANRAKTHFLANMSHELRTPLNAVLGLSESLIDEVYGSLTVRQRRALSTINRSGRHLLGLINDVLDLARVEAGELAIEEGEVNLPNLVRECVAIVKESAEAKQLTIRIALDAMEPRLRADPRRLRQLVLNLLENAIKFSPCGATVVIGSAGIPELGEVRMWVSDTGPGIAPDKREDVFLPFVTLDRSLTRKHGGAGLGLSLVRRIAELHDGRAWVETAPGGGAKVVVALPCKRLRDAAPASSRREGLMRSSQPTLEPMPPEVLLLGKKDWEACSLHLRNAGYRVKVAEEGADAEWLANGGSDLLIIHEKLGDMTACEIIRAIRKANVRNPKPVIAVTEAPEQSSDEFLLAGADCVMSTQHFLADLITRVKELLQLGEVDA